MPVTSYLPDEPCYRLGNGRWVLRLVVPAQAGRGRFPTSGGGSKVTNVKDGSGQPWHI